VRQSSQSRLAKLAAVILAVAVLYVAGDVLQPLALATLLAFLLAPASRGLERLGLRRWVAVGAVTTLAFLALALVAWLVMAQVIDLADGIARYRGNLIAKVRALQEAPGPVERANEVLTELGEEIAAGDRETASNGPPLVVTELRGPFARLAAAAEPLLGPLGTFAVVAVFVVFFLLEREDLRDRLIRLAGEDQLLLTTQAIDDAGRRVSRYLLAQLLVNVLYGIPVGIGLWLIGVPNAPLWGLLAVVLRYLPYLGPWLAAAAPLVLALGAFPDWTRPLLVLALFAALELVINNLVEPYVYGAQVGLSPVALLLAALLWTWLWGPLGLMLAAPLTVCLAVLGQHVPQLEFLAVVFGDGPALPPASRLYQRLLAGDTVEAAALVDQQLTANGRSALYEDVLRPAVALAERDRQRGALDGERLGAVLAALDSLLADLPALEATAAGRAHASTRR
jgi:predicted PurR-regulated permease PerM